MALFKFHEMELIEKVKILYRQGTFVMSIRYYGYKVNLFILSGNYFEVFYNHKYDRIDKIALLEREHSRMKFYEDQIKDSWTTAKELRQLVEKYEKGSCHAD